MSLTNIPMHRQMHSWLVLVMAGIKINLGARLDSIAVSLFGWSKQIKYKSSTVSDGRIKITILILRRGPCLIETCSPPRRDVTSRAATKWGEAQIVVTHSKPDDKSMKLSILLFLLLEIYLWKYLAFWGLSIMLMKSVHQAELI